MPTFTSQTIRLVTGALLLAWGAQPLLAETTLRWTFKQGEKITFVIEEKQATKMTADKDVFDLTQTLLLHTTWTIKAVHQNGKAEIGVTIDRVRLQTEGKGQAKIEAINYDSTDRPRKDAKKGLDPLVDSTLGTAVGEEFTLKMDPRGQISDVKVSDKLAKALATNTAKETAGFFGDAFQAEGIRRRLTDWVIHLPEAAVSAESKTWTDKRSRDKLATFARICTHQGTETIDGKELEKIDLKPELTIQREPDKAYDKITSQEGKGTIYFDKRNGRPVEYILRHKVATESYVLGKRFLETKAETIVTVKLGNGGARKKGD